jgi:transposase
MPIYVGLDIGKENHMVCAVSDQDEIMLHPFPVENSLSGVELFTAKVKALAPLDQILVGMEATGHYWQCFFLQLQASGFSVCLINPYQTNHFAKTNLKRAKTDPAFGGTLTIARFLAKAKPSPTQLPEELIMVQRELSRLRDSLVKNRSALSNQLQGVLDRAFPEFVRIIKDPTSETALAILQRYPSASALKKAKLGKIQNITYGKKRHRIGPALASALKNQAKQSIATDYAHTAYEIEIRSLIAQIRLLNEQILEVEKKLKEQFSGLNLDNLLSIGGLGIISVTSLVAEIGDIHKFSSPKKLVAHLGVCPKESQSGKYRNPNPRMSKMGNSRVRAVLYRACISAIRFNPVIREFYLRLLAKGKPKKLAICACMRKMIHLFWAIWKYQRTFDATFAQMCTCEASIRK